MRIPAHPSVRAERLGRSDLGPDLLRAERAAIEGDAAITLDVDDQITTFAALLVTATVAGAQAPCPPEVAEAEKLLSSIKTARPPRTAAGARSQDVLAPRGQDIQAPKSQEIQAPRGQDIQAPKKSQDIQAPKGQDIQAPRGDRATNTRSSTVDSATRLVRDARRACNASDMPRATANARAALELLNYLR